MAAAARHPPDLPLPSILATWQSSSPSPPTVARRQAGLLPVVRAVPRHVRPPDLRPLRPLRLLQEQVSVRPVAAPCFSPRIPPALLLPPAPTPKATVTTALRPLFRRSDADSFRIDVPAATPPPPLLFHCDQPQPPLRLLSRVSMFCRATSPPPRCQTHDCNPSRRRPPPLLANDAPRLRRLTTPLLLHQVGGGEGARVAVRDQQRSRRDAWHHGEPAARSRVARAALGCYGPAAATRRKAGGARAARVVVRNAI